VKKRSGDVRCGADIASFARTLEDQARVCWVLTAPKL
jgi:hypothetical protein